MKDHIGEAIEVLDTAISQHRDGEKAPFSSKLLQQIRGELVRMQDEPTYVPGYARFLLDWPDCESELGKMLMQVSYLRRQAAKEG